MPEPFVHLHLHSEFSLVDSTLRIKQMVKRAHNMGMPAIAVTDQFNMFALVKFYQAAVDAGIKPIVGADVQISNPEDPDHISKLVLLCQNRDGYLRRRSTYFNKGDTGSPEDTHTGIAKRF